MTSAPARSQAGQTVQQSPLRVLPSSSRRRPVMAIGSVALVAMCVAVFTTVYAAAGSRQSVLTVRLAVAQGQRIEAPDLETASISAGRGVALVPATEVSRVLGKRAAVPLVAGSVLVSSEIGPGKSLPAGDAIVGVALKPGLLPDTGITPGARVAVVLTGPPGTPDVASSVTSGGSPEVSPSAAVAAAVPTASQVGSILVPDAQVAAVSLPPTSSGSDALLVSLRVPATFAPAVATASAAGQVALVEIGSSS